MDNTTNNTEKRMKTLSDRISGVKKNTNENLSTQDFVKKMRKLNEEEEVKERVSLKSPEDEKEEFERFNKYFREFDVVTDFTKFEVYNDLVYLSGVMDGVLKFTMKATPVNPLSGVKIDYDQEDFDMESEENNELVERLEQYYENVFAPYWRENILQTD